MVYVYLVDVVVMDGIGDVVEGIVDDVVVVMDIGGLQGFNYDFGNVFVYDGYLLLGGNYQFRFWQVIFVWVCVYLWYCVYLFQYIVLGWVVVMYFYLVIVFVQQFYLIVVEQIV